MGVSESVLVTDVHELAGLGTARSLGRAGCRVIGVHTEGVATAASRSRYVAESVGAPDPWQDLNSYRESLLSILQETGVDAVFPVSEASQVAVRGMARQIPRGVTLVLPNNQSLRLSLSKFEATAAAARLGVPIPPTAYVVDGERARYDDIADWPVPYLVKSDNVEVDDGSYLRGRSFRIESRNDLEAVVDRCLSTKSPAIAQRYVPGRGVGAFFLRDNGRVLLQFGHERLHEVPYAGGWSSLRRSLDDSRVIDLARRFLDAVDYQGLAMVEFRRQGEDDPVFLEINGRPWGSIALALHAGVDFPLAALNAARGRAPAPREERQRRVACINVFPGELGHLTSLLQAEGMGRLTKGRLLARSSAEALRAVVDPRVRGDFLWWSDPGPALLQVQHFIEWVRLKLTAKLSRPAKDMGTGASLPDLRTCRRFLFLCYGNICRSPFAAMRLRALLREERPDVDVDSAGVAAHPGSQVPAWFRRLFGRYGLEPGGHRSRQVEAADIERADVVVVMERAHRAHLVAMIPSAATKTWLFGEVCNGLPDEIQDPFDAPPGAAIKHFDTLDCCVTSLASSILAPTVVADPPQERRYPPAPHVAGSPE